MRHSVRARLLLTLVCTTCALPACAQASGGSPVHVDPSSPVAKEYALPLATVRGAPPESGRPGKLFGSGITQPRRGPAPPASATTPETVPGPPRAQQPSAPTPQPTAQQQAQKQVPTIATPTTTPVPRRRAHHHRVHVTTVTLPTLTAPAGTTPPTASATPAAYRVLRPGSGSGLLWMVVAAAAVLAIGSAGGLLLSRRL